MALLTALLLPAAARSGEVGPLRLTDPIRGGEVIVEPDAPLTHLVFFATWCPPCTDELPRLGELEARWRNRGYRLVLVAVPQRQSADRLLRFHAAEAPPGKLTWDADGTVVAALGAREIPAHVLVDSQGNILLRAAELGESVERTVEQTLGGRR